MKLTNAQIYTLRRMSSGRKYKLKGDGKKALECKVSARSAFGSDDISAPSVPVLFRLGLVKFTSEKVTQNNTWYPVVLTEAGESLAASALIKEPA